MDGNRSSVYSKGRPSESTTGASPKSEQGPTSGGSGGGHRVGARSRHDKTLSPRWAEHSVSANPPIAVLGKPNHVDFPGLDDTGFGDNVDDGRAIAACEDLRVHFEKKEVLKARVNFLLYQVF